jgi:hypothetical protein
MFDLKFFTGFSDPLNVQYVNFVTVFIYDEFLWIGTFVSLYVCSTLHCNMIIEHKPTNAHFRN